MAESSLSRSNIRRISPVRTEGGSASGSNIPVAGARSRYDEARATLERGLLESRRRQVLGGEGGTRFEDRPRVIGSGAAQGLGAAEDEIWSKPGSRPEGATDKGNVWVTKNGGVVKKDPNDPNDYSYDPKTGGVTGTRLAFTPVGGGSQPAPAATAMTRPAATSTAAPSSAVPPLLARPQPAAPARQGMIDGRPANRVIADMEGNAQARGNFGAEIANRNIEKMGVQGAVADYFERNRLDRPQPEPGNMAEVRQSLVQGPPTASVAGPAQRAMLESRQRRGEALMQGPPSSAMTVRQEGPPAPLSQSGPPLSSMTVSQAGPPILARPAPEDPSLAYTLGRKTRNAPAALQSAKASAALTLAETGLAVGEAAKRSKGALNSAKAAAALTLARGARDFGAGFSGR